MRRDADQSPQLSNVATVVSGTINRRFENEGAAGELRMIQNSTERVAADFAFADVLVAVHTRAKRRFGIVYVDHKDVLETDRTGNLKQSSVEALLAAEIVAGGEKMRRIHADSQRKRRA